MKLTWYGHSCFLIESEDGSAVLDPYAPESVPGFQLPELTADAVFCSHEHADHNYRSGVALTGREFRGTVEEIPCYHDGVLGLKRGKNTIRVITCEGLRIAHLGDLGHMLSRAQLKALGELDALLIPIGGFYTIDAAAARRIAEAVRAGVSIPMHYRGKDFGYDVLGTVDDFLALSGSIRFHGSNTLEVCRRAVPTTVVLTPPVRKDFE